MVHKCSDVLFKIFLIQANAMVNAVISTMRLLMVKAKSLQSSLQPAPHLSMNHVCAEQTHLCN